MSSTNEISRIIRGIIREALSLPENSVRPANQNAPVGDGVFATVLIASVDFSGWDDYHLENLQPVVPTLPVTQLLETIQGQREFDCSVQFFREGAVTFAARLKALFQSAVLQEKLQLSGIGFISCSQVKDLSGVQSTFWEERSQLNINFYVLGKETVNLNTYVVFPIELSTEETTMTTEVTVL